MRKPHWAIAGAASVVIASTASCKECQSLAPSTDLSFVTKRSVEAEDIVGLRDIAAGESSIPNLPVFSLSSSSDRVAFQLRQADPLKNTYCLGIFVANRRTHDAPVAIDRGGELITVRVDSAEGLADMPTGVPETVVPKWSPDDAWLAFLRRDRGRTQVWRARADGSQSEAVTHVAYDVQDFQWGKDGETIIFKGRPALVDANNALLEEGRSGFLYDARFAPIASNRPFPLEPIPSTISVVALRTGEIRVANSDEASVFNPPAKRPKDARYFAEWQGKVAWVSAKDPNRLNSSTRIQVQAGHGNTVSCDDEVCNKAVDLWWSEDGETLFYLKREAEKPKLGFYAWKLGKDRPRQIFVTDNALVGCHVLREVLLCASESSRQPRQLVSYDIITGAPSLVFDPNPELAGLKFGSVERLHWTNNVGIETYGDLVLPPDYQAGTALPLLIVGYASQGFLRGGTGDEYPIHVYAARGYAVLSFSRPPDFGSVKGAKTFLEMDRMDRENWADFKSVQSSIDTIVDRLIQRGITDPDRIGLTGMSNGVATGQFALINSKRFKAAAFSNCCEDRSNVQPLLGPLFGKMMTDIGYPGLTQDGRAFWAPYSLTVNAATMNTPLLIQVPDDEYLYSLESYTALREVDAPVEMYVFPDEHHMKWQPAHRLAVYNRGLDWFDFWLRDKSDPDPAKAAQYQRWERLRVDMQARQGVSPG